MKIKLRKLKKKSKMIEWQFHVGTNVIVSKNANRTDRIHLNVNMRFPAKDAELLVIKIHHFQKQLWKSVKFVRHVESDINGLKK